MHVQANATAAAADAVLRAARGAADAPLPPPPKGHHRVGGRSVYVGLTRDNDGAAIPYEEIKSITLIALLRLGLAPSLRRRAYAQFVALPLYEDMAPWNIVQQGANFDYIDYDTRDLTFDAYVRRAYQVRASQRESQCNITRISERALA